MHQSTHGLAVAYTAKCLPVSFTLSADMYLAASCCPEGVEGMQFRFPIKVDFKADVTECPAGWEAGLHAVGSLEPLWSGCRTPLDPLLTFSSVDIPPEAPQGRRPPDYK